MLTKVRVFLAWHLINTWKGNKRYFFGRLIAPSIDMLVKNGSRKQVAVGKPEYTHIIYHQNTVDKGAAINSLRSIFELNCISLKDEIIFYNNGADFESKEIIEGRKFEWFSEVFSKADTPEKKSYTYGLNHIVPSAKADKVIVWRTDYIYPQGVYEKYQDALAQHSFAAPYHVIIGKKYCDSSYVENHWDQFKRYDHSFWENHGRVLSLYETQDPALFGITKSLWTKINGLNNSLWGYGWQFAELAARIRLNTPKQKIKYFSSDPPFHQTHEGTQMHYEMDDESKSKEFEDGLKRFAEFLGGEKALFCYKLKWILRPQKQK